MARIDWPAVINKARSVVDSYDTSVTLRQLFYRLVSAHLIPNTTAAYKRLSELTAEQRRHGTFPELIDRGRTIHRYQVFDSVSDGLRKLCDWYRLDRTIGQDVSLYLGVEKAGLVVQLEAWFGDNLGIPILALGGYSSQSYVTQVQRDVSRTARPAVLLYAGDFDPSGEDIDRDFVDRTGCWDKVIRVALDAPQVQRYDLPPNLGKVTDSRAAGFIERHGELVQVELDALAPETLRSLFRAAIDQFWDTSAYEAVRAREAGDLDQLRRLAPQ
jgi:hypothetical protein